MSKGSPTITIRLSQTVLDQIPGIKAQWIRQTIEKSLAGNEDDFKLDLQFLLQFFNRGGSKTTITQSELERVKQIYQKVK